MSPQMLDLIKRNNQTHVVSPEELTHALTKAQAVFAKYHSPTVHFERSVFTNWTCAIADCKYCYLSTKPKHDPRQKPTAIRSMESILAEVFICQQMGWKIGYITGGLRVESTDDLISLLSKISAITGEKIMMNYGPYSENIILKLKPYLSGMGSAIESFDEDLHSFICPSKPLKALLSFLENVQKHQLQKLITIILGMGEKKDDVYAVIENITKYNINIVQLCFLKPQENTVFAEVPSPDPRYMAWWIATIRAACPTVQIKVALVRDRIQDLSLYLRAGANSFSRFMIFADFGSTYASELENECAKAGRQLLGNFTLLPEIDFGQIDQLPFDETLKEKMKVKARQYYKRLQRGSSEII